LIAHSSSLTEKERNLLFSLTSAISAFSKSAHDLEICNTRLAASDKKTTVHPKANESTNPFVIQQKINDLEFKASGLLAEINQLKSEHHKLMQANNHPFFGNQDPHMRNRRNSEQFRKYAEKGVKDLYSSGAPTW